MKRDAVTRSSILLLTCIFFTTEACLAGAWTRKQGSGYAKLSFTMLSSDEAYDQDGNKFSTPTFQTWSGNIYGEYGIFDRLTGIVRFPFIRSAGYETTESFTDIGDISIELKYGLIKGATPVAISVDAQLPTGNAEGMGTVNDTAGVFIALPTGDGFNNTRIKASVSHSLHPIPGYVSFDVGYNVRSKGFTDEYLFMAQGGYKIDDALWLNANINARGPVATPDPDLASEATLGFGEGVQFIAYSLGLAYPIGNWSLSFDVYSAFGRITSIYSGLNLVFGVAVSV